MAFLSFFIAFLLFLYAALASVLDYTISADFNVIAWGLAFFVLGHLAPGAVAAYRTRSFPRDRDRL